MLPIDDDMNELLRRAAENYPLKTDGANWARIEQGLEDLEVRPAESSHRNIYWLLSLLLIPVFVCTRTGLHQNGFLGKGSADHSVAGVSVGKIQKVQTLPDNGAVSRPLINAQNTDISLPDAATSPDQPLQKTSPSQKTSFDKVSLTLPGSNKSTTSGDKSNFTSPSLADKNGKTAISEFSLLHENAGTQSDAGGMGLLTPILQQPSTRPPTDPEAGQRKGETAAIADTAQMKVPSVTADAISRSSLHEHQKATLHRLYIGITAGGDVSWVRAQKTSKPGTSLGFVAGFQLNKHFALEAGVAKSRKNYYSDGQYFDKTGLGINYNIATVEGFCSMWEIPVTLKYTIHPGKNNRFYGQAGVSSYLMKKEDYDYTAKYNGQVYKYNKVYNNASRNWLTALHLGAGYEAKLGKNSSFRIEPYARLPLGGMGVGKLHVTSMGVNAGITKKIF